MVPLPATGEIEQFAAGRLRADWAAAEKYEVPSVGVPGNIDKLVPYLENFPRAQVIMDHTATLYAGETPPVADPAARSRSSTTSSRWRAFRTWRSSGATPDRISAQTYPFNDLAPYARRLIERSERSG